MSQNTLMSSSCTAFLLSVLDAKIVLPDGNCSLDTLVRALPRNLG